jgi:hypothetical protein
MKPHSDILLDALKLNNMDEKLKIVKSAFMLRLINNTYTRHFAKELDKCYNGVPHKTSILHPVLDYVSKAPLTIRRIKNFSKHAKYDHRSQKCKNIYKYDETALMVRGILCNLAEQRHYLVEMLEPISLRFENEPLLDLPHEKTLFLFLDKSFIY